MKSMESAQTNWVRPAAVAGRFYPGEAALLRRAVHGFFPVTGARSALEPKALIAPHAGYAYSGPVAASAFANFTRRRGSVRRIILIGPSHYLRFSGIATSSATAFATPLGSVGVDRAAVDELERLPWVRSLETAHDREHALEVELPFLQELLGTFTIVPLTVGEATPEEVREVLESVWGGPETVILVSSDLSHYHGWEEARRLDALTAERILNLDPTTLTPDLACGGVPISGLVQCARSRALQPHLLDLRNSGDTAGTRDRVVGYGAFCFTDAEP